MKYKLQILFKDSTMIEATYSHDYTSAGRKWTNHILAFVVHEDCLENQQILEAIDEFGFVEIEMKLL